MSCIGILERSRSLLGKAIDILRMNNGRLTKFFVIFLYLGSYTINKLINEYKYLYLNKQAYH